MKIIQPHNIASKFVEKEDFERAKNDYLSMVEYLSSRPEIYALAHSQITDCVPLRFFVFNVYNKFIYDMCHCLGNQGTLLINSGIIINPEIHFIHEKNKIRNIESCASIPEKNFLIHRHKKIGVKFHDSDYLFGALQEKTRKLSMTFSGFMAYLFQHEIDHTNGINICDNGEEISTIGIQRVHDANY